MEQLYMLEIFIDSVTIRPTKEDVSGSAKKLIVKLKFGPKVEFIIRENHVVPDDMTPPDEDEGNSWKRIIRIGKSYLFSSFPDTMMSELEKFPLELEVWTDDEKEAQLFIGLGSMKWDRRFYDMLTENSENDTLPSPLTLRQSAVLYAECCCGTCGEVNFILRLSCLGKTVITEFQQLMKDPKAFVLRTNRAPTTLECRRRGNDLNFYMIGSLYETTTLEAPKEDGPVMVEVCTDVTDCGKPSNVGETPSAAEKLAAGQEEGLKIRMGDITGACGNPNCPLAYKIKQYIRKLDLYKKSIGNRQLMSNKQIKDKLTCGKCICKDERYHRETCPSKVGEKSGVCFNCGGYVEREKIKTCEREKCIQISNPTVMQCSVTYNKDNMKNFPKVCNVEYNLPGNEDSRVGADEISQLRNEENIEANKLRFDSKIQLNNDSRFCLGCGAKTVSITSICSGLKLTDLSTYYMTEVSGFKDAIYKNNKDNVFQIYNCTTEPDDSTCKCEPIKPKPPCSTFDCTCIAKAQAKLSRKLHKPYCPVYRHKASCPVNRTATTSDDATVKPEDNDDENEPLPYGLPPIKLGPCPVLGKPCTQPDGFAKMYKTAALPELPPSYNEAGKICCSKEFERIKKAMNELMVNEKMNDCKTNCVKTFLHDGTEARCCDRNEASGKLIGKSCCATHKLAILEQFEKK